MKLRHLVVIVLLTALIATGCSSIRSLEPRFEVFSEVISHETTQDISVWAPEADGPWPVVYALHGLGGDWGSWSETAETLAGQGVVVFAANYGSIAAALAGGDTPGAERDQECGYRFVRSVADEYGGDLNKPVTMVGHSFGAMGVLEYGLNETYGPNGTYEECFSGSARPDVIVGVAGCYFEAFGFEVDFDPSSWGNDQADILLVGGGSDTVCPAWQSEAAAEELQSLDYSADFVEVVDATHFTLIFRKAVDGKVQSIPDDPAGQKVVRTILDAIDHAG